ncbi:MAG: glycosyltransferase family 4 protein [Candidatus Eisenbacteria bacterium]|nr:glycosyltransferase family 4 protein [Candidatus Eisenbacteria bacterium]
MIRVAFTLAGGAGHWTGGFNYLTNLLRLLRHYRSARVEPVVMVGPAVSVADADDLTLAVGAPPVRADWIARRAPRVARALLTGRDAVARRAFHDHDIDVVFEAGEYFGPRFDLPTVTWVADFQSHHLPEMFTARARWRTYLGRYLQLVGPRIILLSSADARRDFRRFYPGGAGRDRVVPFAVLPPVQPPPDLCLAKRYGLPERFFFLPNQFWKHKNHVVVIDALTAARQRYPEMVVAACGNPADPRHPGHFDRLRARVRQTGLDAAFRVLGMIPREDVIGLMELSVALVNPSLFEGWSTTVEEAKSLGVPLVLSALPVHREQAPEHAAFFDPHSPESAASALCRAWEADAVRPVQRRAGAVAAAEANAERFADGMVTVFEEALSRSVRRRPQ